MAVFNPASETAETYTYPPVYNAPPTGNGTFPAANSFRGCHVYVPHSMKVNRARIRIAVQSGNISAAIYSGGGTTRLSTSGALACPAVGNAAITLPEVTLTRGVYFVGLSADNTTVSFANFATGQLLGAGATTTAHPAPATATVNDNSTGSVPSIGLYFV